MTNQANSDYHRINKLISESDRLKSIIREQAESLEKFEEGGSCAWVEYNHMTRVLLKDNKKYYVLLSDGKRQRLRFWSKDGGYFFGKTGQPIANNANDGNYVTHFLDICFPKDPWNPED